MRTSKQSLNLYCAFAIALALFLSCPQVMKASTKSSSVKDAVEAVLNSQKDAWNRGDLDGFMKGYLHSENTSYTSGGTEVWGYEALSQRYAKKYGQSPETMGRLSFTDLRTFDLGKKHDSALVIGHWHLELKQTTLDGIFSLVFVKVNNDWRIMHDHTSLAEKK